MIMSFVPSVAHVHPRHVLRHDIIPNFVPHFANVANALRAEINTPTSEPQGADENV